MKVICRRCRNEYEQIPNPTIADVYCSSCYEIHHKELQIKEVLHKIRFWKDRINEANYHIKNREKDIETLQSKLKELKK